MKTILSIIVSGISIMGFASAIWADHHGDLAKSGTINYHSGLHCPANVATTPEGITIGTGTCTGVTYNDSGSGPLHGGAAQCHFSFFLRDFRSFDFSRVRVNVRRGDTKEFLVSEKAVRK